MRFRSLTLMIASFCLACSSFAMAGSVDFDNVSAPGFFNQTTYSPTVYPGVTFFNGVILSNVGWNNEATTAPNLYATSDYLPLSDGSLLPGNIDAVFSSPVSNVNFDIINGFGPADFTAFAFDSNGVTLATVVVTLNQFTDPGDTAHIALNASNIFQVVVISGQGVGAVDFATDTWSWNGTPIPEPGSLLLLGSAIIGLWTQRKRFLG